MSLTTPIRGGTPQRNRARTSRRWLAASVALAVAAALDVGVWEADASTTLRVPEDHPTIQAAIQAAADGDVIDVAPGTYTGPITVDRSVSIVGREHDPADPRNNTTILDGGGATVVTVLPGLAPGPSLVGLSIRNGNDGVSTRSTIALEHSHFTGSVDHLDFSPGGGGVVRGNVFELSGDDAVDVDHPRVDLLVEGNRIFSAWDDGIEIRLHDDVLTQPVHIAIRGNRIVGARRDGIQVIDYYQDTDRTITIERNLILDAGMAAIGLMDDAISREDFRAASIRERIHVFHNTIVGADHGISGGDNLIAVGNILQGNVVGMKNVDGGSIASHNLFFGNQTDAVGSVVDETTTVRADPLLDAEHGLSAGSPAIDAGTALFEWGGEVVLTIPEYEGAAPDLGWMERPDDGPNSPPMVEAVAIDRTSPGTDAALTATVTATDQDGDALTHAYQWIRGGVDIVGETDQILDLGVPGNGDAGDQIAVRVTTSDGEATSDPVTSEPVTVVNTDPAFDRDLADRSDVEGASVAVSAGANDPDGDALTYEASGLPQGVTIDASTGLISGTIEAGSAAVGPYPTQVTVRDGPEVDATDTFTWTVTIPSSNTPPVIDAVAIEPSSPKTDDVLTANAAATDADGDDLTYAYRWVRNGVDLAGQTGSTLDLSAPGTGDAGDSIAVRVTASDAELTSDPVTSAPVTVDNSEPVFDQDLADRTDEEGSPVSVSAGASDPDGDPLTYEATGLPPGVSIDASTGLISGTVAAGAAAGGPYGVQITVRDGSEPDGVDGFTWAVTAPALVELEVAVAASTDDAEEAAAGGMTLKSGDLQLVQARTTQTVGLRFGNVGVPAGATISSASVQFRVDEVSTGDASLTIRGQAADDPGTFSTAKRNVSSRPRTAAAVEWTPAPWTTVRQVGPAQRTPDLATVIQEIVDRPGWSSGNALVLIVTGTGRRTADSFDGGWAPVLRIGYART